MNSEPGIHVPRPLQVAGAWSWRLLLVGAAVYFIARVLSYLSIVTVPCAAALLIVALLFPLTARLRRAGVGRLAATWLTMLVAAIVLGGLGVLVGFRANAEFPTLADQVVNSARELQSWLRTGPLQFRQQQLDSAATTLLNALDQQTERLAGTVVTGAGIVLEVLAGLVLLIFVTFFLIKDGDRIWAWCCERSGSRVGARIDRAGRAAWATLVQYVHGTMIIAAIHGIVIGVVMLIMGIPLWAPLAVLIFLGSFVPLAGIIVTGGLAVLVTLGTQGWIAALVLLGIITLEAQLESHLLQPLVVGRMVRLHPLVVILAIATGTFTAGIIGAVIAVPLTAVAYRAWPELRGEQQTGPMEDPYEAIPAAVSRSEPRGEGRFSPMRWLAWVTRRRAARTDAARRGRVDEEG